MQATQLPTGGAIRWQDQAGGGRPTVYLHGLGSAGGPAFAELVALPPLQGRRALLIDLVGFGHSDHPERFDYSIDGHADAVAAALDAAGVSGVDLVGHSLGATIAIVLAHRRSDLVGRLVAVEPNLDPWDGTASVHIARQPEVDFVRNGYAELVATAPPAWAATLSVCDPLALHRTSVGLCELRGTAPREVLLRSTTERTLLWGAQSQPPAQLEELVAAGVRHRLIPGAGHVPMEDNPHAFAEILAEVLTPTH